MKKNKLRIALNGFGRIGRAFTRQAITNKVDFEIVAINTAKSQPEMMAYLLKYDSVYRAFEGKVGFASSQLIIDDSKISCSNEREPSKLNWGELGVDLVLDCSGAFKNYEDLYKHIESGAKQVVMSAPTPDPKIPHYVLGANDVGFDLGAPIISNASCTTNCIAPMLRVLDDKFGIESCIFSTSHAYTSSQSLLDESAKTFQRSRAASLSIIPTTTGAATAITKVLPHLTNKIHGGALRVPVPVGSIAQVFANLSKVATASTLKQAYLEASNGYLKNILAIEATPLVSSDYIGNPFSVTVDFNYIDTLTDKFVSIVGWYDNEWGYSARLIDLVGAISKSKVD